MLRLGEVKQCAHSPPAGCKPNTVDGWLMGVTIIPVLPLDLLDVQAGHFFLLVPSPSIQRVNSKLFPVYRI